MARAPYLRIILLASILSCSGLNRGGYLSPANRARLRKGDSALGAAADATFIIRSSRNPQQIKRAADLQESLLQEGVSKDSIMLLHELDINPDGDFATPGYWTLIPVLPELGNREQKTNWYIFCDPNTMIHMENLSSLLVGFDSEEKHLLGKKISSVGGITQSYSKEGFPYPFSKSGFAMSAGLVDALDESLKAEEATKDFTIDVYYQFAKFVKDRADVTVQDSEQFCFTDEPNCATAIRPAKYEAGPFSVTSADVVIAVKTTGTFHEKRIPILQQTWMADAKGVEIVYMSETADATIPTIDLTAKWPTVLKKNTETATGHCAKFMAIMYELQKTYPLRKWFVVVDDDTILDVPRLLHALTWYDPKEKYFIGQKYAYGYQAPRGGGSDYVTMGGGSVMSKPLLDRVLQCHEGDRKLCTCYRDDAPDDMQMGMWVSAYIAVPISDDGGFHQARANDYNQVELEYSWPISFHKWGGPAQAWGDGSKEAVITGINNMRKKWFASSI